MRQAIGQAIHQDQCVARRNPAGEDTLEFGRRVQPLLGPKALAAAGIAGHGWGSSVGHAFSRRVDRETLERVDSPAQIDSWNRTWTFFEWTLRPYEDRSKPVSYIVR